MSLYKDIYQIYPYLMSVRKLKSYITFDMSFPVGWKFPKKFMPENNVVETDTPNENERGVSFVSEFTEVATNKMVDNILNIINFNKEREEKEKLLLDKVNELKLMFEKQSLSTLKGLKFDLNNVNKIDLIDESETTGTIPEGIKQE